MNPKRLIGSYWTLAANAYPWTDQGFAPHNFRARVEIAARGGFDGFGFYTRDIEHICRASCRPLGSLKTVFAASWQVDQQIRTGGEAADTQERINHAL